MQLDWATSVATCCFKRIKYFLSCAGDTWIQDLTNLHPRIFTDIHSALNTARYWNSSVDVSCLQGGGDEALQYGSCFSKESASSLFRANNGGSSFLQLTYYTVSYPRRQQSSWEVWWLHIVFILWRCHYVTTCSVVGRVNGDWQTGKDFEWRCLVILTFTEGTEENYERFWLE